MSYCRFSSDNFRSDVYVYEHVDGGYTTHVAGNRLLFPALPDPYFCWLPFGGKVVRDPLRIVYPNRVAELAAEVYWWLKAQYEALRHWLICHTPRRDIPAPHGGATYSDPTALACAARLIELRNTGLNVPQCAIDRLVLEAANPADDDQCPTYSPNTTTTA
jgi:hypothetical protein